MNDVHLELTLAHCFYEIVSSRHLLPMLKPVSMLLVYILQFLVLPFLEFLVLPFLDLYIHVVLLLSHLYKL
jgi:hypothetical protein